MARLFIALLLALACTAPVAAPSPPDVSQLLQLDRLEQALKLTPRQQEQYDLAVGATKRLVLAVTLHAMDAKEKLAAELGKPWPDFRALEKLHDDVMTDTRTLRREAQQEWLKLYAMLDAAQIAELRAFAQRRMDHLGLLHDFLRSLPAERPKKEGPVYW